MVWVLRILNSFLRITRLGPCSLKNVGVSLRIHGVSLSTLDLGGRWGRIMVSSLRARTRMPGSWLLCSKPGQRWPGHDPVDPNPNVGFHYVINDSMCIASDR